MLLGIKSKKTILLRYIVVGLLAGSLVYLVWILNDTWSPDMRLWKAFGGASFFLLWFTMIVGPVAVLWPYGQHLLSWRRETGVWFFVIALVHGYLVLDGWVRFGIWEFLGYQYVQQIDLYVRVEPGFGLANLMGLMALSFALALAATSFDRIVNFFGISSWKWLHGFAQVIFYVGILHVLYFAFIHFDPSPQRLAAGLPVDYPENPLRYVYLGLSFSVLLAQIGAFIKTIIRNKNVDW